MIQPNQTQPRKPNPKAKLSIACGLKRHSTPLKNVWKTFVTQSNVSDLKWAIDSRYTYLSKEKSRYIL